MKDEMGHRLKAYEATETERKFDTDLPVYARIDGRCFSKFTRMAHKPFDPSITNAMLEATRELVKQTHSLIGYVQSDEISLVWEKPFFDGKVQKMTSVLAGIATSSFIKSLVNDKDWNVRNPNWLNRLPHFDARVFNVPSRSEATNTFLWREMDARKNAITMVASKFFSHRELQGRSGEEKIAMLTDRGIDFHSYPTSLRRGTFVKRVSRDQVIDEETLLKIPEKNRPQSGTTITRHSVEAIPMPSFRTVQNRIGVIFENEEPITNS